MREQQNVVIERSQRPCAMQTLTPTCHDGNQYAKQQSIKSGFNRDISGMQKLKEEEEEEGRGGGRWDQRSCLPPR